MYMYVCILWRRWRWRQARFPTKTVEPTSKCWLAFWRKTRHHCRPTVASARSFETSSAAGERLVLFVEDTCTVHESWVTLLTSARLQFDEGLREATQVRRAAARPLHPALRERVGRRGAVVLAGATDDSGGASEYCKDRSRSLMRHASTWHAIRSGVVFCLIGCFK